VTLTCSLAGRGTLSGSVTVPSGGRSTSYALRSLTVKPGGLTWLTAHISLPQPARGRALAAIRAGRTVSARFSLSAKDSDARKASARASIARITL
jgi:hypothetical protein